MEVSNHTTHCNVCNVIIKPNRKYCSTKCKNAFHKNNSYVKQQERGKKRKAHLLDLCGKKCSHCGYNKNSAALSFHHKEPSNKTFPLDLRHLSNRSQKEIDSEFSKCELLCLNCHAELHHPDHTLP